MMSHVPNYEENQNTNPTFLATLQTILAVLEDDVAPTIPENTYLRLVNELQILYGIHSTNVSNTSAINNMSAMGGVNFVQTYVIDTSNNIDMTSLPYRPSVRRVIDSSNSSTSTVDNNNIINIDNIDNIINIDNFTTVLSRLEIMYNNMSYVERDRAYENSTYNNLMNIARGNWRSMSSDEQRNYRTNMQRTDIEFGGPVHRIIYPRS